MIIKYDENKLVKEQKQMEIKDSKNVFLKGRNWSDNREKYFGIWDNGKYLLIVKIGNNELNYEFSKDKNIYTESDIRYYLEHTRNIEIITKNEFEKKLKCIMAMVKI